MTNYIIIAGILLTLTFGIYIHNLKSEIRKLTDWIKSIDRTTGSLEEFNKPIQQNFLGIQFFIENTRFRLKQLEDKAGIQFKLSDVKREAELTIMGPDDHNIKENDETK